jgi:hypothetical protein
MSLGRSWWVLMIPLFERYENKWTGNGKSDEELRDGPSGTRVATD